MSKYGLVWSVVARIPHGRVSTYGDVARIAGFEGHARLVGYALHASKSGSKLPWHRVINAKGKISLAGPSAKLQRKLLLAEKIAISPSGRVDLIRYRWHPELK